MVDTELIRAHLQDRVEDLALHRSLYKDLTNEEWRFFLQQVEGYQRTKDKLPLFGEMAKRRDGAWWYPPRISCEQCSSEVTARHKAALTPPGPLGKGDVVRRHLIDLTGGAGVDTYFMSEQFDTVDYVEQNEELCRLAVHNLPQNVSIHNCSAEHYLSTFNFDQLLSTFNFPLLTTIYIDPARRDKNGGKVFKLADCTPNVVALLPRMRQVADTIMIKLSPMLDITEALRELGGDWEVHVVAVKNEVKEIVLLTPPSPLDKGDVITAVDLAEGWKFEFSKGEEERAQCQFTNLQIEQFTNSYLYEPCAAILKAGAYKLVGMRYGLDKLGVNTHLYVSDQLVEHFPGRCWRIVGVYNAQCTMHNEKANVLTRNYPLSAEQLKQKLHVKDGGSHYIIGTRIGDKPILLFAERL